MKKRFLVLIVCVCALLGAVISASGSASQENSLVSQSYLEGVFLEELAEMIVERISGRETSAFATAMEALNAQGQAYLDKLGTAADNTNADSDWIAAGGYTEQGGEKEDVIILNTGASLVWLSGSAEVSGTLIDLTAGKEVSGGGLTENHRYVAAEKTTVTVSSRTARWSVEGEWQTNADGISVPEVEFTDVPEGQWYYDAVYYVVEKGLFKGVSDTEFAPNSTMTRGMLTTVLHRLYGSPAVTYSPIFSDVPSGKWYTDGTVWAGMNGVVNGMGDGTFKPLDNLSRQQIAVMLYNYARWLGYDTSARADLLAAPDGNKVAGWAQDAVSWAVASGIIQGGTGGVLSPGDPATRAQVATMLMRFESWMNG